MQNAWEKVRATFSHITFCHFHSQKLKKRRVWTHTDFAVSFFCSSPLMEIFHDVAEIFSVNA